MVPLLWICRPWQDGLFAPWLAVPWLLVPLVVGVVPVTVLQSLTVLIVSPLACVSCATCDHSSLRMCDLCCNHLVASSAYCGKLGHIYGWTKYVVHP